MVILSMEECLIFKYTHPKELSKFGLKKVVVFLLDRLRGRLGKRLILD